MARACEICGSRKWRRDAITGGARCEEGHLRQGYRAETLVVDQGASNFHMIKRRKGTGGPRRNKRKEEGRANPEYYHGFEAEYLRIQALQLLLRLQVQALSRLWSLPGIYEVIVRDLWAYQLSIASLPTLPDQDDRSKSPSPLRSSQKPQADVDMHNEYKEDHSEGDESEKHGSMSGSGSASASGSGSGSGSDSVSENGDKGEYEVDPEILERLDESDKEEGLDQLNPGGVGAKQGGDMKWKRKKQLKISDTIITLVVGLWILRIPVMGADIENLVNHIEIPYVDFGHTTHIPTMMKKRMNRDVIIALSPLRSPSPAIIHRSCRIFARVLNRRYGIQVPEVNLHPVIWRITSSLGGTPTTYVRVTRLMAILDLNMSLLEREIGTISRRIRSRLNLDLDGSDAEERDDPEDRSEDKKIQSYEKAVLYLDVVAPEVAVVVTWLIVMKMTYGLDGVSRKALLKADPAIGLPMGSTWVNELQARLESGVLKGKRADLEKKDFTKMDDDEMDAFLSQCQDVLLGHREEPSDVNPFPLPPSATVIPPLIPPNSWISYHSSVNRITYSPASHISAATNNKTLPLMPGEKVRSYDSSDPLILNDLPTDFEVVLNAGCQVIGWDKREVLRVLEGFERKLEKLRPKNEYVPHPQLDNESDLNSRRSASGGEQGSRTPKRSTASRRGSSSTALRSRSRLASRKNSEAEASDYVDEGQGQDEDEDQSQDDNLDQGRGQGRKRLGPARTRTRTRSFSQTRERPTSRSRRGSNACAAATTATSISTNGNAAAASVLASRLGTLSRESSITRAGAGAGGRRSRETSLSRSGSRSGGGTSRASGLVASGSRSKLTSSRSLG
ncbi:hypothetical protein I316_01716 [Kwoniella heveanensis BCC8398]|uniref:Rrn7/TAF1B C-terminal cyclin domain-containing protein n=1 Tax=Kwoniella heveanensis BCC8398 TaxID=1296120 RepID=A0A1B9GZN7_9TREE|nr:hypothetical protein I316_01716 [Kwoniella heveanensis BCC8398]